MAAVNVDVSLRIEKLAKSKVKQSQSLQFPVVV